MGGERILIVDDEPAVLRLCARTLAMGGYQVREASGGREALVHLQEEPFDLLVVDLLMPEMSGVTLLQKARELDPGVTAMVITGHGTMESTIDALQAGARGFLLKPFAPDALLRAVDEALEKRRRAEETWLLRAQLPILQIGQTLMAEGDIDSLPGRLLEVVARQIEADRALLLLLDEEAQELYPAGAIGLPPEGAEMLFGRLPVGKSFAGQALSQEEALLLDGEADQDPALQVLMAGQDRTAVCVPLRTRNRAVGVLALSRQRQAGTPSELNLLSIVGGQIAISLENARLYEQAQAEIAQRRQVERDLRQQNEYLAALHEIGLGLITRRDLTDLLGTILSRASTLLDTSHGYIWLLEPGEDEMEMRAGIGVYSQILGRRLKPGQTLAGRVWKSGRSWVVDEYRTWPDRLPEPELDILYSVVGVPLLSGSQVVGVLGLAYAKEGQGFRFEEIALLSQFAELASIALDNARLYGQAQMEIAQRKEAEEALHKSEQRYRQLFEDSSVSLWEEDLSAVKKYFDNLRETGVRNFRVYLKKHPEALAECARMARVLDVNKATLEFYGVEDKEALLGELNKAFAPESYDAFREELVAVAEGRTRFESEAISETLAGQKKHTILRWSVAPGYEGTLTRVLVSIVDITERVRAEEALQRSLEETAHSQRLLLALSQAAQAVQRAHTAEEVFQTITSQIAALGYQVTIFTLTEDRMHLAVTQLAFKRGVLRAAEKLMGLSARDYCFPLVPGGFYQPLMAEEQAVFSVPGAGPVAEALPKAARPLAGRLAALLGVDKAIYAPLKVGGEVHSLLAVMGADLTEADVPAVTAFASQAAIALENARLYEQVQTRSRYLETLQQINATLRSTLSLDKVLETIVFGAGEALGYAGTLILLPDAQGEHLTMGAVWGGRFLEAAVKFTGLKPGAFKLPLAAEENPMAQAYLRGELQSWTKDDARIVRGVKPRISPKLAPLIAQAMGAMRATCVPLPAGEELVGVLVVFSPREQFPDEERAMLLGLADQAGLAIHNAQLYQAAQQELAERKRAERALRESEELFRLLFEHAPIGMAITDLEGQYLRANPALCKVLGYSEEEMLKRGFADVTFAEDTPANLALREQTLRGEIPSFQMEKRLVTKAGGIIQAILQATLIRDAQGQPLHFVGQIVDITDRKRMEEALRRSEAKYRNLVEQSDQGVWEVDSEGVTVFANSRMAQILGHDDPQGLMRYRFQDFAPKADLNLALPLSKEQRAGRAEAQDCMLQKADGTIVHTILSSLPHLDEAGRFTGATLFVTDITERKQMEEALKQSEKRYRTLFESAADAIFIHDLSGQILAVNHVACERLGYSQAELLQLTPLDLDTPEYAPLFRERIEALRRYGHHFFETVHLRRDGTTVPTELSSRLIEYEGMPAVLNIARDITERKRMEQVLLHTERLAAMGHLAAALAHEINNPLQSIGNSIELVLDFPLEEWERQEYLEAVRQEIDRLMALTSRVLDFARPPRIERRPTSVADAVHYALTLAGKQLAHSRIVVNVELPDSLPLVLASHDQLAQVFLNLIINAIEAMPEGGRLGISARSEAGRIELAFADSGPGIPADALDKIFEPFHTTKEEGTGLGLAVSYSIIQQHGGIIVASNAPGGGAVLTVNLPLRAPDDTP